MAVTRDDVEQLEKAIRTGATKVRFADNREVTYRSLADMRSVLAQMQRELGGSAAARPNRLVAGYLSNLS